MTQYFQTLHSLTQSVAYQILSANAWLLPCRMQNLSKGRLQLSAPSTTSDHSLSVLCLRGLRLLLVTETPVMMPNGIDFSVFFFASLAWVLCMSSAHQGI